MINFILSKVLLHSKKGLLLVILVCLLCLSKRVDDISHLPHAPYTLGKMAHMFLVAGVIEANVAYGLI